MTTGGPHGSAAGNEPGPPAGGIEDGEVVLELPL